MFSFYCFLSSLVLLLICNRLYFVFNKKIIYLDYIIFFTIFIVLFYITFHILNIKFKLEKYYTQENVVIFFFVYTSTFLSLLFTMGLKTITSPSEEIYNIIRYKKISKKNLLRKIKNKKIVSNRINDLINQNLIIKKKNSFELKGGAQRFCGVFLFLKKIYNIKIEG